MLYLLDIWEYVEYLKIFFASYAIKFRTKKTQIKEQLKHLTWKGTRLPNYEVQHEEMVN